MVNMLTLDEALFVGSTESLWKNRTEINAQEFEGCVYIQP